MKKICVFFLVAVALLSLGACSRESEPYPRGEAAAQATTKRALIADMATAQKARNPYLAFEHYYRIELPEALIRARFEATVDQCSRPDFFGCTLVEASLNEDRHYVSGNIQLRIRSGGIDPLISTAAQGGEISSQSSRAEDLAKTVMDTKKRLEMLKSYRERLESLESRAADDIESLIKVSAELARVQSEIEQLQGSRDYLQKRLDLDLLNIHLYADTQDDLLAPIAHALERFLYNLSSGTSGIITTIAWTLPWAIGLLLLFLILRWAWRRARL